MVGSSSQESKTMSMNKLFLAVVVGGAMISTGCTEAQAKDAPPKPDTAGKAVKTSQTTPDAGPPAPNSGGGTQGW
jgi:hypothetical protein